MKIEKYRQSEKRVGSVLFFTFIFSFFVCEACLAQDFVRLKGYYRTYLYTDSVMTHVVDGMMEFFIPTDGKGEFADRKILGERLQSDGSNEIFLRMALPNLETTTLLRSIDSEEYSLRNNGDVFLMNKPAGHISRSDDRVTIEMDNLAGRENHELDMSQMKLVGFDARMVEFTESESYLPAVVPSAGVTSVSASSQSDYLSLVSTAKHQAFVFRQNGEHEAHRADVFSEFYVTDRTTISKQDKRKVMRQKNKIRSFQVPDSVSPLPLTLR